jgi:hypothetical protein
MLASGWRDLKMKRFFVALAIGATMLGGVTAFAASLGGVTVNNFGAGHAVVASCDTNGVNVHLAPNNLRGDGVYVTAVTLSSVDAACNGKWAQISVLDDNGSWQGGAAGTVNSQAQGTGVSFNVVDTTGEIGVKAELIGNVSIIIS